ncbi:uncharacterized protein BO95DRAFT_467414 [Aspergillus brunneoviolaceus CBS 621.78]|uniref:Uncharacterized protein n=1 Tax=Aspergillus brunneoviolaceus CBS 621.78 TaxID=1450534 RepID=A0ACD1FY79_9EURO|nr:hypothetical protein BO95DRAFT_467414 [Aspergillus brunneoviolaceus CBS 621.78]RAH41946.1 hypothetical protein BO95DRAFT_467414 [Aspergillus brunneoviolaceus CBS 621.78]
MQHTPQAITLLLVTIKTHGSMLDSRPPKPLINESDLTTHLDLSCHIPMNIPNSPHTTPQPNSLKNRTILVSTHRITTAPFRGSILTYFSHRPIPTVRAGVVGPENISRDIGALLGAATMTLSADNGSPDKNKNKKGWPGRVDGASCVIDVGARIAHLIELRRYRVRSSSACRMQGWFRVWGVIVVPELSPSSLSLSPLLFAAMGFTGGLHHTVQSTIEHHHHILLGGLTGMEATQTTERIDLLTKQNSCCSLTFWAWQAKTRDSVGSPGGPTGLVCPACDEQ